MAEKLVQQAIDQLQNKMTIVWVTHRLATVRSADVIYVLERGRIVETGTWEELTHSTGLFHQLWNVQSQGLESKGH